MRRGFPESTHWGSAVTMQRAVREPVYAVRKAVREGASAAKNWIVRQYAVLFETVPASSSRRRRMFAMSAQTAGSAKWTEPIT